MVGESLQVVSDLSVGDWITTRLTGRPGAVTGTVPTGYAAYARICHPAMDMDGNEVSWPEVAEKTGRQPHPLMQWHALVGSADWINVSGTLWEGKSPRRGNLDPEMLAVLCDLLPGHTTTPDHCYFCLWEGYGGLENYGWLEEDATTAAGEKGRHLLPLNELESPRLQLPDRNYVILAGPLQSALRIGSWVGANSFFPQSPNLFWPSDRAWFVASEIDFDSTLVAGSVDLVEAILQNPTLDAWPVQPDDPLTADADTINVV